MKKVKSFSLKRYIDGSSKLIKSGKVNILELEKTKRYSNILINKLKLLKYIIDDTRDIIIDKEIDKKLKYEILLEVYADFDDFIISIFE